MIKERKNEMKIKVEINLDLITDENKYEVCDKINIGLSHLLEKYLTKLIFATRLKTGEPLYNISVVPIGE